MSANPAEIRAELKRILASSTFSTSERSVQFLRFCVEETLNGNRHQIKETTVALQVFGRSADYDPRVDPIVRVHARRVRKKLEEYYSKEGISSLIQIRIPKGTYVPEATRASPRFTIGQNIPQSAPVIEPRIAPAISGLTVRESILLSHRNKLLWLGVLVVALMLCLGGRALWNKLPASASVMPGVVGEVRPLNAEPGREQYPSWSPDGKTLAYTWASNPDEQPHIYLQKVGESGLIRLTKDDSAELRPVWSPDGAQVAFVRPVGLGRFEVVRASVHGGAETIVDQFSCAVLLSDDAPALDWSPDGRTLLVAEQPSDTSPIRLVLVDLATGFRRPITNPPTGNTGDVDGKFSPDGALVAFQRGGLGDLYVVAALGESSEAARRLTQNNPGVRGIAWSRDGRHILFGSMEGGFRWTIWQVDRDGSALREVFATGLNMISPAISPDGRSLAAEQQDIETNLMEIPLHDPASAHLIAPSSRQDYAPVYAPDGKNLVFISTRSGTMELWTAHVDGNGATQLTHLNGDGFPLTPSWSPDSQELLYALRRDGATNIWRIRVDATNARPITRSLNRDINPVFGPDGRYVYYNSNRDGIPRIWRVEATSIAQPEPMMWDTPWSFQASWPERSLFSTNYDADLQIMRRDLVTGTQRIVFQSHGWVSSPANLCIHGSMAYVIASPSQSPATYDLLAADTATGAVHILKKLDFMLPSMTYGCSVNADGTKLLVPTVQRNQSDINIATLN